MIASHADGAMAMPHGAAIFERNVLQRTRFHALATMDAGVGDMVFRIIGSKTIEPWIDHMAFQPSHTAHSHFGKTFLVLQLRDILQHCLVGGLNFSLGVLVGIELEARHTDVSLRHLQAEAGIELPALFLDCLAENLFGEATFVAHGASEINVWQDH